MNSDWLFFWFTYGLQVKNKILSFQNNVHFFFCNVSCQKKKKSLSSELHSWRIFTALRPEQIEGGDLSTVSVCLSMAVSKYVCSFVTWLNITKGYVSSN